MTLLQQLSASMPVAALYWLASLIIVLEALNKVERVDVKRHAGHPRSLVVELMKLFAWGLLALAGAGGVVAPFIDQLGMPGPHHISAAVGFAILIVRTRLKEAPPGAQRAQSDDFTQTQVFNICQARQDWEAIRQAVYKDRTRLRAALAYGESGAEILRAAETPTNSGVPR